MSAKHTVQFRIRAVVGNALETWAHHPDRFVVTQDYSDGWVNIYSHNGGFRNTHRAFLRLHPDWQLDHV